MGNQKNLEAMLGAVAKSHFLNHLGWQMGQCSHRDSDRKLPLAISLNTRL